jgi:ABC-type branched-subunit amino acid transport system substrate-binding protein
MAFGSRAVWVGSLALVAGGASFGQVACSSSSSSGSSPDAGADGGTGVITIGFSNALTGGISGLGVPLNDAARVAEQQVNQVGVLGGRQIHIEVVDDLSDSMKGAPNAANHFIAEKVPAVLGPLTSGECLAVNQLYAAHKIVEISPSATSVDLTNAQPMTNRYFFRTAPADNFQGKAIAKLIYSGEPEIGGSVDGGVGDGGPGTGGAPNVGGGCRNAYLVNGDDDYGNGLMQVVHDSFLAYTGTQVLGSDKVSTTLAPSYATEVGKVVMAKPDCLVLVSYSDVGAQFMRDLRTATGTPAGMPLPFPVYGADGLYDSAFIPNGESTQGDLTSANVCESVTGTTTDPAPNTPQFQVFQTIWQSSFPGMQPPAYSANLYDAVLVLALAIQKAGTATDGEAIRNALYQVSTPNNAESFGPDKFVAAESAISSGIAVKYIGASGPMTFDQYGNVQGGYIVWRVDKQPNGDYAYDTVARISSSELQ